MPRRKFGSLIALLLGLAADPVAIRVQSVVIFAKHRDFAGVFRPITAAAFAVVIGGVCAQATRVVRIAFTAFFFGRRFRFFGFLLFVVFGQRDPPGFRFLALFLADLKPVVPPGALELGHLAGSDPGAVSGGRPLLLDLFARLMLRSELSRARLQRLFRAAAV